MSYAKQLGFSDDQIRIFRESGASGEDMDRPALTELLEAAAKGYVSDVIVKHPDRLSRNVADKALIVRELQKYRVKLAFIDVPDWDKSDEAMLLFNIISSIAEYELRQIRRRTLSGKLRAAREGQVMPMGIDPYGYRYENGCLYIVEEEAVFVRMMFRWYAMDGLSMRAIALRLDELGAPTKTRRRRQWSHATVQHILSNPMYGGRGFYNRRVTAKASGRNQQGFARLRRVKSWRPPSDWIPIIVPPIVDASMFELVAARRLSAQRHRRTTRQGHLLSGRLSCVHCHQIWHAGTSHSRDGGVRRFYRRPAERRADVPTCPHQCPRISADTLERAIWTFVASTLIDSKAWRDAWREQDDGAMIRLQDDVNRLQRVAERLAQSRVRITNLFVTGDLDHVAFHQRLSELAAQGQRIQEEIDGFLGRMKGLALERPLQRERIEQTMQAPEQRGGGMTQEVFRQAMQLLVDTVVIDAKEEGVRVDVRGVISALHE